MLERNFLLLRHRATYVMQETLGSLSRFDCTFNYAEQLRTVTLPEESGAFRM